MTDSTASAAPLDLDALEREARGVLARSNPRNHDGIRIAVHPDVILALVAAARRGVADTEKVEEALDDEQNAHLETQRALVLLANQLETHSVPFVPDAEAATAKARHDVEQFDKLFARGMDAARQAYQNAKAKRDAARAALPTAPPEDVS